MPKKDGKNFTLNQNVFAKMRTYPYWPAKITAILDSKRYEVTFYGCASRAAMKSDLLEPYDESHCKQFITPSRMRNLDYRAAVEHIELDLGIVRKDESSCEAAIGCPQIESEKQNHQKGFSESINITNQEKTKTIEVEDVAAQTSDLKTSEEVESTAAAHVLEHKVKRKIKQLFQFYHDVTTSLDINDPTPDEAIKTLKIFKTIALPEITPLMLLKYPEVVAHLKRLRKYVGNLEKWNLHEDEEKVFKEKASKICSLAIEIYNCIQIKFRLYPLPFWETFNKMAEEVDQKCENISKTDLYKAMAVTDLDEALAALNKSVKF